MFYGHAMFIGNRQKEAIYFNIFSGLSLWRRSNSEKLTRFKIAADTLITFAGEFFLAKKKKTQSRCTLFKLKSVLYPLAATALNRRR